MFLSKDIWLYLPKLMYTEETWKIEDIVCENLNSFVGDNTNS